MILLTFVDVLKTIGTYAIYILVFAVVLGLIVGIHEFGHFIFARRGGILCREYAIGMGPVLWKKKKGETLYALRAIPLGGFCAIAGEEVEDDPFKNKEFIKLDIKDDKIVGFYLEDDNPNINFPKFKIVNYDIYDEAQTGNLFMTVINDADEEVTYSVDPQAMLYYKKQEMQIAPYNRTLGSKSIGRRAMVMFGGPMMNFVLALIVFLLVGLFTGFADYDSNELGEVTENSNIYELGLREGDKIIALETDSLGKKMISNWNELSDFLDDYRENLYLNEYIKITYKNQDGKEAVINATPFVAVNSAGFGSTYDYLETNKVVVGVVQALSDELGDNSQLKEKDEIVSINGINVTSWKEVVEVFADYDSKDPVKMTVLRENQDTKVMETQEIEIIPYSKKLMENQTSISGGSVPIVQIVLGISPTTKFNLFKSFGYAFRRTGESFLAVFQTLELLFSNTVSVKNLSGPIGIFSLTSQAAKEGILYILSLIGLLSVNIGLLNLFPIPALDGGRLVFLGYELVTRKKPNPKVETILITVTMILLLGLMVFVSFGDIARIIKG